MTMLLRLAVMVLCCSHRRAWGSDFCSALRAGAWGCPNRYFFAGNVRAAFEGVQDNARPARDSLILLATFFFALSLSCSMRFIVKRGEPPALSVGREEKECFDTNRCRCDGFGIVDGFKLEVVCLLRCGA